MKSQSSLIYCLLLSQLAFAYTDIPSLRGPEASSSPPLNSNTINSAADERKNYADEKITKYIESNYDTDFAATMITMFLGYGIIGAALIILIHTEWKCCSSTRFYDQCLANVKETSYVPEKQNHGKIVYSTGILQSNGSDYLTDSDFPIVSVSNALLLRRVVFMY